MKYLLYAALSGVLFLVNNNSFGQTTPAPGGLYMTAADFSNDKLSYQQEDFSRKYKIRADQLGNQSKVKVIKGNESFSFDKSSLYGFRDSDNQRFRLYNNNRYKILDAASFMLYSRDITAVNGKERTRKTNYYFSAAPGTEIISLTMDNLKKAYAGNRNFHDLLDMHFKNDRELTMYDKFYKQYKVKYVFDKAAEDKTAGNF